MRVSFYTIGCRLNQAETAIIEQSFRKSGYHVVDFSDFADVVVINTCTVTEKGDADTRRIVNKALRTNHGAKIALIGCQAQTQQAALFALPNVHWIIGNEKKMNLADIIRDTIDAEPQLITPVVQREDFTIPGAGIDLRHTRANLKIQDGCNSFCTFCEIPYARGRAKSRVFDDILREANELVAAGHRELVLTGVNIGAYNYAHKKLIDVVDALTAIGRLKRLRLSSVEGTTITPELFDRMRDDKKLCRHLHISIQSANDEILAAMNRNYTVAEYRALLQEAHAKVPGICLGTDVIVGFPGETDAHFMQTYMTLRDLPFAYFHVFSYSERGHAKSRKLANKVSSEAIERRSAKLRELSARKRLQFYAANIGKKFYVLFEQKKNGYWTGLTDSYIRIKVKSDLDLKNKFVPVVLDEIDHLSMTGTLV
ncbi:tRNA (N(6)-L-threonylcarbamoyladenosine(37)-C(2))-methylthiotransferase MtaB [candidate division KSB1 bacterium]|nr:tRNA (N(6)-L-threonylcarbamoyladenosine(37)-C(2))-methylthiotransferase MtaB [candidate division KSB1 bacterium]RQW04835.1 MAG: tRNA (N(6)-L-threonylcarbamoyladenosine(37)-C(2))-methylthiotransferase MtaB [candidate division KSB1 bacterium]